MMILHSVDTLDKIWHAELLVMLFSNNSIQHTALLPIHSEQLVEILESQVLKGIVCPLWLRQV